MSYHPYKNDILTESKLEMQMLVLAWLLCSIILAAMVGYIN